MRKLFFLAILLFFGLLHSKMIMTLSEVQQPTSLSIIKSRLFISDKNTIHCYSLEKRTQISSIGRVGQGPGEFHAEPIMFVKDFNEVLVNSSYTGKIITFNIEGKVIEEKRVNHLCNHIESLGKNYVIRRAKFNRGTGKFENEICLYNSDFRKTRILLSFENIDPVKEFPAMGFLPDFKVNNNNISVLIPNDDGFNIDILDKNGEKLHSFKKKFQKVKVPQKVIERKTEERKKISGQYWSMVKKSFYVPEFYPFVQDFMIQNTKIYIQTWFEKDDLIEFIILDLRGKEISKKYLPYTRRLYTFSGDKYYFLKENLDNETWELHFLNL